MLWKLLSSVVLINFFIVSYVEGNGTYIFLIFFCQIDFTEKIKFMWNWFHEKYFLILNILNHLLLRLWGTMSNHRSVLYWQDSSCWNDSPTSNFWNLPTSYILFHQWEKLFQKWRLWHSLGWWRQLENRIIR